MERLDLRPKKFYLLMVLLLVLVSTTIVYAVKRRNAAPAGFNNVAASGAFQDPKQAAYYRKNAAAFRKQAESATGERKVCYNAWADYYDCRASQLETGSTKACAVPSCNPQG